MHRQTLLAPALLLSLAGCGGNTPESAPPDAAAPAASQQQAAAGQSDADTGTTPQPTEPKTFRDWVVACDNGLACRAVALAPEHATEPAVTLVLDRAAGPGATPILSFSSDEDQTPPLAISVDGKQLVRGGIARDGAVAFEGDDAMTIAAALGNGRRLTVADTAGKVLGDVSLSGAAAALRWIDAQQDRAGTTGALVARGKEADAAPAPALPVIRAASLGGEAALLDPARVAAMKREAGCETDRDLGSPQAFPLDGRTLVLLPCSSGAYNLMMAVFLVRDGKHAPAEFDVPSGMSEEGAPVQNVVDGGFTDGVLTSFARGRGLGDCGIKQQFVWDGHRFRLSLQEEMPECRGSRNYLPTWRARVAR
jgi:predicted small lipoprotein YifL